MDALGEGDICVSNASRPKQCSLTEARAREFEKAREKDQRRGKLKEASKIDGVRS